MNLDCFGIEPSDGSQICDLFMIVTNNTQNSGIVPFSTV
jgi:hypothetical protein